MKNLKPYLLFIALLSTFCVSAQKQGKFTLIVATPDAYVKIDSLPTEKMPSERAKTFTLTEGVHYFQIWASRHELTKDSVHIAANAASRRVFNLKRTEAYLKYRSDMSAASLEKVMLTTTKILTVGLDIGMTWLVTLQGRTKSNEQLQLLKDRQYAFEYSNSLIELPNLKRDFEVSKTDYENSVKYYNTKLMVGIPLTLAAYYGTYRLFKKINKTKPKQPEFKDQNPLSKTEYRLSPMYNWAATGSVGMNLNIKF